MVSPYGLDAGDTLGVVPAENKLLHHLRDSLDAETAVDDGVLVFVLSGDALKMFLEQKLNWIDPAWLIDCLTRRGKLKGCLSLHIEL